MWKKNSVTVI